MSRNNDVIESLLSITGLLKQLTEEVEDLVSCFYEEDEDEADDSEDEWGGEEL